MRTLLRWRTAYVLASLNLVMFFALGALALASHGGQSAPDVEACKQAMAEQYHAAITGQPFASGRPPACSGIDAATLQRLADEIISEETRR